MDTKRPLDRALPLDSVVRFGPPIVLALAPLVFLRTGGEFENHPKSAFLQLSVGLLALVWLGWGTRESQPSWRRTSLDLPIVIFCVACVVSLFGAMNASEAVPRLLHWGTAVLLYFLLTQTLRGPAAVPRFFLAATLSCLCVSIVGLTQVLLAWDWIPQSSAPGSTFSNRNMASHFVAICFPLTLGLIAVSRNTWLRAMAVLCLLLSVLYLFHARTRSAWLAVLLVSLVTAVGLTVRSRRAGAQGIRRTMAFIGFALVLAAALFGFLAAVESTEGDGTVATRLATLAGADRGTIELRTIFWRNSLAMARDHPWFGVGPGNFRLLYPRYHRSAVVDWTFGEEYQLARVHNDHLQILVELGIIGLLAWLAIFVQTFRLAWVCVHRGSGWISLQTIFVSLGVGAFLVVASFSFPMERAIPPVYLFALLGMIAFLHVSLLDRPDASSRLPAWMRWSGMILLLGYLSLAAAFARTAVLTSVHYTMGLRLTRAGEHVDAIAALEMARDLSPDDVDVRLTLAGNHAAMDRCDLAVDELQYVLRVHPLKVNAMANLGYCNLQLHRYDEAERNFKRALEILPDSPQLYTNLGTSYFAQNKHELAIEAYREAIELAETTSYLPSPRGEARILQPRLLLANLYVAHDRLDEAIEQYEEALRLAPEREDIRRLLDEIHREAGRPEPPTE